MISFQDSVKYIGLAVIIYFLIKAFTEESINDKQIAFLVLCIMGIVLFLSYQSSRSAKCPKSKKESYQITDPPLVDSIYPQKPNSDLRTPGVTPNYKNTEYKDPDIQDFKDIMRIDKQTFEKLMKNEQKAMDVIQDNYRNEMVYTETHPFNTIPLGTQLYGYTYLPPENWFRAYERPPVCVTDKRCPVCPTAYSNTAELMQFDTSNNVVGPDGIDLRYVKKVLNKDK
jgi:hypothetical protein